MSMEEATDLLRATLVLTMLISAPILMVGLVVGVLVSLVQAITQIQEQTLTFIPKILAMVAVTVMLIPWMGQQLVEYTTSMLSFTGQ